VSRYIVICRDDSAPDGTPGNYVAATHRLFTAEGAAQYAPSVAASRAPRIVTLAEYLLVCGGFRFEEQWR
jgi:hypothetical protein